MEQINRPFLSVVIPALNEQAYLPRTLESLARQTYQNFEVIVVDNNSTDATARVAAGYGARVIFEPRAGVCAARDAGTRQALGQIIISTDADSVFRADWLAKIVAAFQAKEVVLVAGPPRFMKAPLWGWFYASSLFGLINFWYRLSGNLLYVSAANLAFKKSAWAGYNVQLTQGGDELYVLKQLRGRGQFRYLAGNPVPTSSRRLKKGFLYNLVMTFCGYYACDYFMSKLVKRSLFGSYPAIRDRRSQRAWGWKTVSFVLVFATLLYTFESHPAMAHALAKQGHHLRHLQRLSLHLDADGRKF